MNRLFLRERAKWWLFPGINLHARLRWRRVPDGFGSAALGEERLVLDAGCGNGMLSYRSACRGNRVCGVSVKEAEIEGCRRLFNGLLQIPESRLRFDVRNLYDVERWGMEFDEIICCEVLEHLRRDVDVCRSLWRVLRPGGALHLTLPNAAHPDHAAMELDAAEQGGHVRPGYTIESCRSMLEPLGFRIEQSRGLGGPVRQWFNKRIILCESRFGFAAGLAVFAAAAPFAWLDPPAPMVPYSIYLLARKP